MNGDLDSREPMTGGPDPEWVPPEPTPDDLRALERMAERRRAIEAADPADRHQATVRRHRLAALDEMEEAICLLGHDDPRVAECWRRLAALDALAGEADSRVDRTETPQRWRRRNE